MIINQLNKGGVVRTKGAYPRLFANGFVTFGQLFFCEDNLALFHFLSVEKLIAYTKNARLGIVYCHYHVVSMSLGLSLINSHVPLVLAIWKLFEEV